MQYYIPAVYILTRTLAHVTVSHSLGISVAGAAELGQRVVALAVPLFLALAARLAARSPGQPHAPATRHWAARHTQVITPWLGLCRNGLTPAGTPRTRNDRHKVIGPWLGLCRNVLTPAGTPRTWKDTHRLLHLALGCVATR